MNDQRSLIEQLQDLVFIANKEGLYDAADFISNYVTVSLKEGYRIAIREFHDRESESNIQKQTT